MKLLYSSNIPGVLENISISQIRLPEFYYRDKEYDEEIENLTFSHETIWSSKSNYS